MLNIVPPLVSTGFEDPELHPKTKYLNKNNPTYVLLKVSLTPLKRIPTNLLDPQPHNKRPTPQLLY